MVLKILFWNMGRRPTLPVLATLADEHAPDLVIVAESPAPEVHVVEAINVGSSRLFNQTINFSSRLQFFVGFEPEAFQPIADDLGISSRRVALPATEEVLVVAVHLSSKRYLSDDDQAQLAPRLRAAIDDAEKKVGHSRTVLIGDFNMNPFELGMVSSEGAHGVMSAAIAQKQNRKVHGRNRAFFYNPMWSLMGDQTPGPAGTYFYYASKPYALYWHMFDQVLLRPDLAFWYTAEDVRVLDRAGERSLLTSDGRPDPSVSDHLPLLAVIKTQEVASDDRESLG